MLFARICTFVLAIRGMTGALFASAGLSVAVRRVTSVLGDDCLLHCEANMEPEVQYLAVRWYKVINILRVLLTFTFT